VGERIVDFGLFKDFLFKESISMNFEVRPVGAAVLSRQRLFEMPNLLS
jgi:hypothetical protein